MASSLLLLVWGGERMSWQRKSLSSSRKCQQRQWIYLIHTSANVPTCRTTVITTPADGLVSKHEHGENVL